MFDVRPLGLDGVVEITPKKFGDARGFFSETYNADRLARAGVSVPFVQDNHSFSAARGTLRGLHFQMPPFAQDKLVRVVRGAIYDVAVDIRKGSPAFGNWAGIEISAKAWNQILVPRGFAHGFMTLEPDTEVIYKVSAFFSPEHDRSVRFDDPAIGIDWPAVEVSELSAKDMNAPLLGDVDTGFEYGGNI